MRMIAFPAALFAGLLVVQVAQAVSVGELIGTCGDDAKAHCKGVGYGDPMQACLDENFNKLNAECKLVMERLREGEKVTLF